MLVIKRMIQRREAPACQAVGLKKASFVRVKHKSVDMTTNTNATVKLLDARIPDVTHENHLVIIDGEEDHDPFEPISAHSPKKLVVQREYKGRDSMLSTSSDYPQMLNPKI
jgi:hypothetical protein